MSRAFEKPPRGVLKSGVMGGKSLRMALRGPNKTRQRGAACTKIGSMKAASIIAEAHRPLITSHNKTPSARAARATSAQRPASPVEDGPRIGVEDPAPHLDRRYEQRKPERRVGQDSQIHRGLSSRAINASACVGHRLDSYDRWTVKAA